MRVSHLKKSKYSSLFIVCFCTFLLLSCSGLLFAAGPLEVVVEGIEGDALANVTAALAVPEGLVEEGKVNVQGLEYFKSQVGEKAKTALEPFGYYGPQITVGLESADNKNYRLIVRIKPGKPVRVTKVDISLRGPGAREEKLRKLVREFPLHKGDVLLHQKYEVAKGALKSQALDLGYLDARFKEHNIFIAEKRRTARIVIKLETGTKILLREDCLQRRDQLPGKISGEIYNLQRGRCILIPKDRSDPAQPRQFRAVSGRSDFA